LTLTAGFVAPVEGEETQVTVPVGIALVCVLTCALATTGYPLHDVEGDNMSVVVVAAPEGWETANATLLLIVEPVVTTTNPDVAPFGTVTTMLVDVHVDATEGTPLKVTVPEVPKFTPEIVTVEPIAPEAGEIPPVEI
jgi:hypothetical protein